MKKALIIISLFVSASSYGQGLFEYFKLTADDDGPEKFDRIIFDANFNNWVSAPAGINQGNYSLGFSAYWMKDIPLGKKSNAAFAFGAGFDSHNVHSNGRFITDILPDGSTYTNLVPYPDNYHYRKNKVSFNYIEVPVELRLRTMNKSREERRAFNMRVYLGFKAGWLISDHTKYIDAESKYKVFYLDNTMDYRYGPTLRIGFNKIAFNAFYSLTPVFEEGKGVELIPFSVGLSWMRF